MKLENYKEPSRRLQNMSINNLDNIKVQNAFNI